MSDATVKFGVLCDMLEAITRTKKAQVKRKHLRTFFDNVYTDHEYFSAMRLILPDLDKERANYGLRETVLAKFLAEALGLSKDSEDAKKLLNWRKGGSRAGSNAGNFPLVATEVLQSRQRVASMGLKIKDINDFLDRLAAAQKREEKVPILANLISKTNALEMRWAIMIILKDLKLGISEKTVFREFHPDSEDLFNVTCDLKLVCHQLRNRTERYNRKDIEVGKAVRPQLAARVANVEEVWKKLRGKQVVAECKFDGDRIQVHKSYKEIQFFSRSFIDHQEFKEAIADVIVENVVSDRCILDGEMLVWDRLNNRFAEFGSNREIAKLAKEGLDTDQQLCYMAFDILFSGDTSLIHLPLYERHQLLRKAVKEVKGRLYLLLPQSNLQLDGLTRDPCWSVVVNNVDEVEQFFKKTVENREEGIVVKDLDSKWEPGDRSTKWLKLKPDYVQPGSDIDALIIGGYFGSGRRGGEVAQFLLGIAEKPKDGEYPSRFLSFCKVGSGLTDEECDHLVQKLKPYFRHNEKNTKAPSFYIVTNNAKERPDVWIEQPNKSVIVEITSDIRTIKTEVFAAPFGLRFPRVHRVRYEKPWYDCINVQTLVDIMQTRSASLVDLKQTEGIEKNKKERGKQKKRKVQPQPLVPYHMRFTDISHVKQETRIFADFIFYFANYSGQLSKDSLHELVVENGGVFSMNLNNEVTHAIASTNKGIKYQAAASLRDVIHCSWVIDCCKGKALLPLTPKYFLNISSLTKEKMKEDIDLYGDHYYLDIDAADLSQLMKKLHSAGCVTEEYKLAHYKIKYGLTAKWCQLQNCVFYFHKPIHSIREDSQAIAESTLKRQELEVCMRGGGISTNLTRHVTHMIVYTVPEQQMPLQIIVRSVPARERDCLLSSETIKILSHRWIEDCVDGLCKDSSETNYNLRDVSPSLEQKINREVLQPSQTKKNNSGQEQGAKRARCGSTIPTRFLECVDSTSEIETSSSFMPAHQTTMRVIGGKELVPITVSDVTRNNQDKLPERSETGDKGIENLGIGSMQNPDNQDAVSFPAGTKTDETGSGVRAQSTDVVKTDDPFDSLLNFFVPTANICRQLPLNQRNETTTTAKAIPTANLDKTSSSTCSMKGDSIESQKTQIMSAESEDSSLNASRDKKKVSYKSLISSLLKHPL